jgi:alpha-tubulin suppressor-like RCC1 family protein
MGKNGKLGHAGVDPQPTPKFIEGVFDAVGVSCGNFHSAILHADGTVSTFGQGKINYDLEAGSDCQDDEDGSIHDEDGVLRAGWLGHGDDIEDKLRPQKIDGIANAVAVSCGTIHTIICHADGRRISTDSLA